MAIKTFGPVPFPPLRVEDIDSPIDSLWLNGKLKEWDAKASLLLRTEKGAEKRGGFFFHLAEGDNVISFHDFEGKIIIGLDMAKAVRLMNHVSGRRFDEEMLTLCQRQINLRQDY